MDPKLWNLLHDGILEDVEGSVPGDVRLAVSIRYLRQRFPGEGTGFVIVLRRCTQFSYTPYDGPPITELVPIVAQNPEILIANPGDPLEIACVMGTLFLRYASAQVELDTGGQVQVEALDATSKAYWRDWSDRTRSAP